jgi:hypothetical protein
MPKGNNTYNSAQISLIGVKVPSFLTVSNSPITSSGTIEIDYNHTPLPISSGGTGITAIGSKGQILSVISDNPEQLGWVSGSGTGTVTSVSMSVPSFLSVTPSTITSSGLFKISQTEPIPITSGGTGLTTLGSPNQILTVNEEGTNLEYKTFEPSSQSVNLKTSTSFLSTLSEKGFLSIDCSTIPPTHGGTGLSELGQPGEILTVNSNGSSLEFQTPKTFINSISMSVPEFLSVSPSTITSEGTFNLKLSSKPIPITSGGTGLTILGSSNQILSVDSSGKNLEYTTPTKGTVTSVSLSTSTAFLSISPEQITSSGFLTIDCSTIPTSYGGTGLSEIGQANQILTSNGSSLLWTDLPKLDKYLTSIETMFPLSYSDNTLSISSYTGFGRVVFENSPILVTPTLGDATSSSISLNGSEAGSVKLSAKSGSYNFIFPTSIGNSSQILTSQGPFLPTTWSSTIGSGMIVKASQVANEGEILSVISTNPLEFGWISGSGTGTVTSVSMSVPSFLSVTPSTITSSGLFEISLSSEPIPISSGGTGLTTLGSPNQILTVNEEGTNLVYKSLLESVTSINLSTSTPFLLVSKDPVTTKGSLSIDCTTIPITHGGTGLSKIGQPGQILKINSDGSSLEYVSNEIGVTSISITVPPFLSVTPSTITSSGVFEISQGIEPISISYGGTGLNILGSPNQILSVDLTGQKLEYITPTKGTVTAISLLTSTPFLSISPLEITSSGSFTIDCSTIPITHGGTGLVKPGLVNQILTSNGSTLEWSDPPKLDQYLTTINTTPPLLYSNNTLSISSFTGSGKIVFDTSATLTDSTLIDPTVNHLNILGTQSGTIKISASSGNYNFILPTTYGKPFHVLTAQGPFNPSQWTSTTGSGDIVCSKNPILSGQTIFTNGTVLCKSKIIQSQGIVTITSNTTLTIEQLFSFLIVDSETETEITLPALKDFNDFIGDYTIGNRVSTLIQNKCPNLKFITSEGITLIDGRSTSAINVQELNYVMINDQEGILLLK